MAVNYISGEKNSTRS